MPKTYIEPGEVARLEAQPTNPHDRLLICLLAHLGCRISEALALTVQDIDFQRGTITIQHLKTSLRLSCPECGARLARRHKFCPGCSLKVGNIVAREEKQRRLRTLPADNDTMKMLQHYVEVGYPKDGCLFNIGRKYAWQLVKGYALAAGLEMLINPETGKTHFVSPHQLRNAFAIRAIKVDNTTDGVKMLQEWLGHSNINTTMGYRKVSGGELKSWYERVQRGSG